jgi:hypothetical protein
MLKYGLSKTSAYRGSEMSDTLRQTNANHEEGELWR